MSTVSFTKCDNCAKLVEHKHSTFGWVHLDGSLIEYLGTQGGAIWLNGHIDKGDFCSMTCLTAKLESKRPKNFVAPATAPTTPPVHHPVGSGWDQLKEDDDLSDL